MKGYKGIEAERVRETKREPVCLHHIEREKRLGRYKPEEGGKK